MDRIPDDHVVDQGDQRGLVEALLPPPNDVVEILDESA